MQTHSYHVVLARIVRIVDCQASLFSLVIPIFNLFEVYSNTTVKVLNTCSYCSFSKLRKTTVNIQKFTCHIFFTNVSALLSL